MRNALTTLAIALAVAPIAQAVPASQAAPAIHDLSDRGVAAVRLPGSERTGWVESSPVAMGGGLWNGDLELVMGLQVDEWATGEHQPLATFGGGMIRLEVGPDGSLQVSLIDRRGFAHEVVAPAESLGLADGEPVRLRVRVNVSTVDGSISRTRFYVEPKPSADAPAPGDWTAAKAVVFHTPVDMEPATGAWSLGGDGSTPSLAGSIGYFHAITDGFSTWRGELVAGFDTSDPNRGFAGGLGWLGDPAVIWTLKGDAEYEGPKVDDTDAGRSAVTTTTRPAAGAPTTTPPTSAPPASVTTTTTTSTTTSLRRPDETGDVSEAYDAARLAGVRNGLSGMWVSRAHPGIHWFVVDHLGLAADGWTLFGIDARSTRLVYRGHFARGGEGKIPQWADVEDLTGVYRNGRWYLAIWDNGTDTVYELPEPDVDAGDALRSERGLTPSRMVRVSGGVPGSGNVEAMAWSAAEDAMYWIGPRGTDRSGDEVRRLFRSEGWSTGPTRAQQVASLWPRPSGTTVATAVGAMDLSADGNLLAVAGVGDNPYVMIWEKGSGQSWRSVLEDRPRPATGQSVRGASPAENAAFDPYRAVVYSAGEGSPGTSWSRVAVNDLP